MSNTPGVLTETTADLVWALMMAVARSGLRWTIIRPTWVFGPGDVSLNRFLGFARVLPFVPMTNFGSQELAPVFVRDVAELAADAFTDDAAAEQVFEIGGPETLSMREVLHRAMDVAGTKKLLLPAPAPLVKLASWPMRFLLFPVGFYRRLGGDR